MWQELIRTLKDLSDAYAALFAIAKRKRAVLVAVDLKGLESLVEEEKQQLERIREDEKRRQDALLVLSKRLPGVRASMTMAEVETACPAELRQELKALHERLIGAVAETQEMGEVNEFLIRQALGAVEYHLNRLSNSAIEPTYGHQGQESVSREKKFDFHA